MKLKYILVLLVFAACSDGPKNFHGISYTGDLACEDDSSSWWLADFKVTTMNDSVLFNTKELGRKLELEVDRFQPSSTLYKLFSMVCIGDSVQFELPADSFYNQMGGTAPVVVQGEHVKASILMHDRLNQEQYQAHKQLFEEQSIAKYVEQFSWNATYDSATGIWYEKLKTVRHANGGFTKAKMKYVMKNISDQMVSYSRENEPLIFDKNDNGLLKGIKFVGELLNNKESIRAIVPSKMAFGPRGIEGVPANQPIILEMELLEVIE